MVKIAAVIMVKNERVRIGVTIASVQRSLDAIVLYDTGSDDDTVDVAIAASRIPIHVKRGNFVDFATSRNEMLDYADSLVDYDYYLLLDANDELIGDLPHELSGDAWYVEQRLKYGPTNVMSFRNVRLVAAKRRYRYEGVVHEYLDVERTTTVDRLNGVHLFQDRTLDDDGKTVTRWKRDVDLLERQPASDTRVVFYLAQTYQCLGRYADALIWYEKRFEATGGFQEERFASCLRIGEILFASNKPDDASRWFMRAVRLSSRAEPMVRLAGIERDRRQFDLAYAYARLACELPYPVDALLPVDVGCYEYTRWHLLGIVAYYSSAIGADSVGKIACEKAIEAGYNRTLDESNAAFYSFKEYRSSS